MKKRLFTEIPRIEGERIVLRPVVDTDADALRDLVQDETVYRYLPTYLFERQFDDVRDAIRLLYADLYHNKESLILGVSRVGDDELCGFCELYGPREEADKISLGYRFRQRFWGQGIATETVGLAVRWLYSETTIELITASTMIENLASARVLEKNGFVRTVRAVEEDWGYEQPTLADKWFS